MADGAGRPTQERTIRRLATGELTSAEIATLRELFAVAWPDPDEAFDDEDWQHALGGVHVLVEADNRILSHAAVVPRTLHVGGRPLLTGYVEAVATWPGLQRRGHGTAAMREVGSIITESGYELGALGTGAFAFYGRLGWARWRGPSSVRAGSTVTPTPEDDGYIMVLRTPLTPPDLDLDGHIVCEWRTGDVW